MLFPYIYDIILVLIVGILVWSGWRAGFLATLLQLLGWVAALFLVLRYSQTLAAWTFDNVLQERIIAIVAAAIPQELIDTMHSGALATQDALLALQQVLDALSGFLGQQTVDTNSLQSIIGFMENDGMSLAQSITETILQPVIVPLLQALFSLILFILCVSLFRSLSRAAARRNRNSYGLLGGANRLLGGAVGLVEGIIVAFLYAFVLSALAHGLGSRLDWLNPDVFGETVLVKLLAK